VTHCPCWLWSLGRTMGPCVWWVGGTTGEAWLRPWWPLFRTLKVTRIEVAVPGDFSGKCSLNDRDNAHRIVNFFPYISVLAN
jgi:hypothetical protein